jgi:hypothetical protein
VAINRIFWNGNEGFDIHVLKGETSPSLLGLLVLGEDTSPPKFTFANAAALPADLDKITFTPNFLAVGTPPTNAGISVNTGTGAVTAPSPLQALPSLRSFVIEAAVTTKPPNPKTIGPIPIRVYVHDSILDFWLTPNPLTLRRSANDQQLTVLAEFDDHSVGDITRRPGITWASADATKIKFATPTSGKMEAKALTGPIDITATHAGLSRKAKVSVVQPWSTAVAAKLIAGSAGVAKMATVPNILFLPDGFTDAEKPKFEALVKSIVNQLQSNDSFRPYDLLKGGVNFFMAFIPSPQRGTSVLYDLDLQRRAKLFGAETPDPIKPSPPTPFTLPNLIWSVGLPTPADASIGPGTARINWAFQYGPGVSLGFPDPVYAAWQLLSDHRLANERNSTFGIRNGQRPAMDNPRVFRSVDFNPLRTTPAHLVDFFKNLRLKTVTGPMIGTIWTAQDAVGSIPAPVDPKLPAGLKVGQDLGRVYILLGGARDGGTQLTTAIVSSLTNKIEVSLAEVAGSKQVNLEPFALPSTPAIEVVATVAHETSHAFSLLDEYGDHDVPLSIPAAREPELLHQGNNQPSSNFASPGADIRLDPAKLDKIKWLWPRVDAAGVLDALVVPGVLTTDIKLKPGHAKQFEPLDVVRLRRRPLVDNPTPSVRMVVSSVTGDTVTVLFTAITPADFPVGSVLIRPVRGAPTAADPLGPDLPLMAPIILSHLKTSRLPLNRTPPAIGPPVPVCAKDTNVIQVPPNLPAGRAVGRPRFKAQIVGLYDGGNSFHCGVYHPSGACLMRALKVPGFKVLTYLLCPVCRYVIVDRLDPTKHSVIDKDLAKRYPEP